MATGQTRYTISRETSLPFAEAADRARELLEEAGYGVLCEIDVKAKLEEKLGIEREGTTHVAAIEPQAMLSVVGNKDLDRIAEQVREDLTRVVDERAGI